MVRWLFLYVLRYGGIDIKKVFDKEYRTQYPKEMKFLESVGIKYKFVKEENGITTYKYEKTPELFYHLWIFYKQN
jgi:hypothetical protein